ncbi:hypothetical protein [Staphylococcus felis]|uniref:hypothetical protein n=1 Tax=Staphylococcus felis TaxID=46127 RepID=UPI0032DB05E3
MVNQTEFVDNLKKRMNMSIEDSYYLESITCSYAIIENRIKRIVLHLNIPLKSSLYENTKSIYNKLFIASELKDEVSKNSSSFTTTIKSFFLVVRIITKLSTL